MSGPPRQSGESRTANLYQDFLKRRKVKKVFLDLIVNLQLFIGRCRAVLGEGAAVVPFPEAVFPGQASPVGKWPGNPILREHLRCGITLALTYKSWVILTMQRLTRQAQKGRVLAPDDASDDASGAGGQVRCRYDSAYPQWNKASPCPARCVRQTMSGADMP